MEYKIMELAPHVIEQQKINADAAAAVRARQDYTAKIRNASKSLAFQLREEAKKAAELRREIDEINKLAELDLNETASKVLQKRAEIKELEAKLFNMKKMAKLV